MDAVQKVEDLTNMALDERGNKEERLNAALGALRIIREYKLLSKKRIDIAVAAFNRLTNPAFVDEIADRAEKLVSGVERTIGSAKKLSNLFRESERSASSSSGPRRRRYDRR